MIIKQELSSTKGVRIKLDSVRSKQNGAAWANKYSSAHACTPFVEDNSWLIIII